MGLLPISEQKVKGFLRAIVGMCFLICSASAVWANQDYVMGDFSALPITIHENSATPQVQINASNDQQLYFKAYNDYSDLDDDGIAETTYKHSIDYYGYFDNHKCYKYSTANNRFEPASVTSNKYCNAGSNTDEWSGNFLNWASMTRIDAIRKILFGGHRRVDTKDETVLERAFIPPDIHAFAKYYNHVDLPKLTPVVLSAAAVSQSSSTAQTIGTGTKVFSVANPVSWCRVGDFVTVASTVNSANFMEGSITDIDSGSSQITVNITGKGGSGSTNSWLITNNTIQPETVASTTYHTIDTTYKSYTFTSDPAETYIVGDYVEVSSRTDPQNIFMRGWVSNLDSGSKTISIDVIGASDITAHSDWTILNTRPNPDTTYGNTTLLTIGTGKKKFSFSSNPALSFKIGDALEISSNSLPTARYMKGLVSEIDSTENYIIVDVRYSRDDTGYTDWEVANLTRTGITFCNVTYSSSNSFSQDITDPPLIRVADGNYAFWAAGEVHQCLWEDEDPGVNGKNYNNPEYSGVAAAQDNPSKTERLGGAGGIDYVARVVACKDLQPDGKYDSSDGTENCKQYPNLNWKPIGLLQEYGDNDQLLFGMIAGTYGKSTTGGDMVMPLFMKNNGASNTCREINLGRDCDGDKVVDDLVDTTHAAGDGTFKHVFTFVGGPAAKQDAEGVINAWSIYRIKGYEYGTWNYGDNTDGDKCPLSVNFFGETSSSECQNWGNPFAEIYLTALGHWVGNNAPQDYQTTEDAKGVFQGLNYYNGEWEDPLNDDNYCAPLSIINFNSSIISSDTAFGKNNNDDKDELDSAHQGIEKDLDAPYSSTELTRQIGIAEGISDSGKTWFVGETTTNGSKTCTPKSIPNLGEVRGICPEGPGLRGGYRIAGMAWYAHTNDIRPDTLKSNHALQGEQTVDNYSVRLASGNPEIEIPVPGTVGQTVKIIPSCIDNNKSNYGCTLADFKVIEPHHVEIINGEQTGRGKFLAIWEDSLQGNDYDLDAGGTYEYEITARQIKVTTAVTLENLGYAIGHGYVISGTTQDGLHIHSGTNGFQYNDPTGVLSCSSCVGYVAGGTSSTVTYTLGGSSAGSLEDPLWYAAKWGGFVDKNGDKKPGPDITEWDSKINKTGAVGSDGIPDNYFYASHPQQLEDSLRSTFNAILERTSSGTAAAVVSSNVRGEGALFQAFYEPLKKQDGKEANWVGTLQALWLDSFGLTRQDCTSPRGYDATNDKCIPPTGPCVPDGKLDNYCVDQVVQTYYDDIEKRTRVRVYSSNSPDSFAASSMQGVVTSYTGGVVTMVPNSLEGLASYDAVNQELTLSPYFIIGTVAAYNDVTGVVTINVNDSQGPIGEQADSWDIENIVGLDTWTGKSFSPIVFPSSLGSITFTVEPAGTWINVNDTLTLTTKRPVGRLGESFSDWDVQCVPGSTVIGKVHDIEIESRNSDVETFVVDEPGDFSGCTMVKISSYDMQGTEGSTFDAWKVSNLETIFGTGTSATSLTLANSGEQSFDVDPTNSWLAVGDRVSVATNSFSIRELYEVGYLWNARKELYLDSLPIPDTTLRTNRIYGTNATTGTTTSLGGRYITTWVDSNLNGDVDAGEYRDFVSTMLTSGSPLVKPGFFDVDGIDDAARKAEAEDVINYIRGIEVPGTRNRKIKYSPNDTSEHVMRLGDIINATPTVVGSPQEAFNLLYNDSSYAAFRKKYQDRRVMIYVGGNDGLFHAFNGGFFNVLETTVNSEIVKTVEYSTSGFNQGPSPPEPAVEHPLGGEMWAYAPYNLLPHLQWLKDIQYAESHVYYMDAKPRVFDANIFPHNDDHPDGWGTVLVAGMNLGGGLTNSGQPVTLDTNSDDPANPMNTSDNVTVHSAYIIFDITNPEVAPQLLGEIPVPDNSFSTVYPAVLAFRDTTRDSNNISCSNVSSQCVNKWYLQFGTGPSDRLNYTSSVGQTAKMYLFDLAQLKTGPTQEPFVGKTVTNDVDPTLPPSCEVQALTPKTNIIVCDTGVQNAFMGTPVVVDWDLDFYADTSYFGLVGGATADSGRVMRFSLEDDDDPVNWLLPTTFFQSDRPVYGQPTPAIDNHGNKWVYFGSGRYFANADKTSTVTQSLFGIKDDETGVTVLKTDLLDVTDVEVYTDRTLKDPLPTLLSDPFGTKTSLTTFDEIEDYMDETDDSTANGPMGWMLDLPPIEGIAGTDPATRNVTRSALLGGVLFSSVFQPSTDSCTGEGLSRLYGLFYKTGTAYPGPTIFGTSAEAANGKLKYRSLKYIDLGRGFATAPAIHSGAGTGGDGLSVFTQLSTGDIARIEVDTVDSVRTGKTSWSDR